MDHTLSALKKKRRHLSALAIALVVWFVFAEVGSQAWYAMHESKLPKNPVPATGEEIMERLRHFADEQGGRVVSERDIGTSAMEILKCSYGQTLVWEKMYSQAAVTILKWGDRSVVGGVESSHNPGNCLSAAGWTVGAKDTLGVERFCDVTCEVTKWQVTQGSVSMQAYSAVFRRYSDSQMTDKRFETWRSERLATVVAGRRDAPVLILLAYLPLDSGDASFRQIMQGLFCKSSQ